MLFETEAPWYGESLEAWVILKGHGNDRDVVVLLSLDMRVPFPLWIEMLSRHLEKQNSKGQREILGIS